ncbi:cytochrome-c peroxidase [Hyphomicrobium denitrificans 1NES1]|uniref:Cytochrome-c peroxidase n=1 Tax=Hyphomicrobium denitrificans 1NES1 TaxID=670307 RepID=N0B1E8_9HYPH|nr:cytochrome c peroxidase [Hyphomicrobium denitrificans]AGK57314.1 cytochrome-c peroxidase [Hyphomicrobium denitrificans 1NES1]
MTIRVLRLGTKSRLRKGVMSLFCEVSVVVAIFCCPSFQSAYAESLDTREELGSALFSDRNLSFSRKQNCMSCHSPELAFTDPRALGEIQGAISRGGDGRSLGDRNSPTLSYAHMTPPFHILGDREAVGGMFWDGRAESLETQVGDPILNPVEMGMPDKGSVVSRLRENPDYQAAFSALFGDDVLADTPKAFAALRSAITAFLRTPEFSPFDSKYDRSLRGEAPLSDTEIRGHDLFFSKDGSGCNRCHSSAAVAGVHGEAFTNFGYVNLGVPKNTTVRRLNRSDAQRIDHGLMENPAAKGSEFDGKFKVPTLRNVAVTGPYMHNGVFQELRTAILFHQRYSTSDIAKTNPETGNRWDAPEVETNVVEADLRAQTLADSDIDALIAFLKTLTDRRYKVLVAN